MIGGFCPIGLSPGKGRAGLAAAAAAAVAELLHTVTMFCLTRMAFGKCFLFFILVVGRKSWGRGGLFNRWQVLRVGCSVEHVASLLLPHSPLPPII